MNGETACTWGEMELKSTKQAWRWRRELEQGRCISTVLTHWSNWDFSATTNRRSNFRVKSYWMTVYDSLTGSERAKVSTYYVLVNGEGSEVELCVWAMVHLTSCHHCLWHSLGPKGIAALILQPVLWQCAEQRGFHTTALWNHTALRFPCTVLLHTAPGFVSKKTKTAGL